MSWSRAYLWYKSAPQVFWIGTAMAVAHPYTRSHGLRLASFGFRATANVTIAGSRALLGTTLVRGGATTVGGIAGGVAAGYAIGAVTGTGISYALFGQSGMEDALDFYSGQVSFKDYISTVAKAIDGH
jgi:hypothetical protein